MQTKFSSSKPKSVFIICEPGSHIYPLIDTLNGLGLHTLNQATGLEFVPSAGMTKKFISKADVVLAVLKGNDHPSVYVELGYALGLKKPTAIIGESLNPLFDTLGTLYIRVPLFDKDALKFQLHAFLSNLDFQRPRKVTKPRAENYDKISKVVSSHLPSSALERELLDALENSAEIRSIVPQPWSPHGDRYLPDFAIWLTNSSRLVSSPAVIEVKSGHLSQEKLRQAVEQIRSYAQATNVKTAILVLADDQNLPVQIADLSPLIFVLSLSEARALLLEGKFGEALHHERNRFVHSAM